MIDSVLKGTGNSRFLKSAVPAGTSWADALAMLQAGTFPIDFNGINTEGFQQVGTPLNKANLLKDATAAQIGLPPSTTPDGMFQALGNTGELHVWRKTVKNAADVPAGYNLGAKTTKTILNTTGDSGGVSTIYYSSSVSVSDSGEVSLKNPASTGVNIYTSSLPIVGKFFYIVLSTVHTSDLIQKKIYFVPSDTDISVDDSPKAFSGVVQEVTGYAKVPAGTTTTYPVSTNPNAYQEGDDAKPAGYTLGEVVIGNKAVTNLTSVSTNVKWGYGDVLVVSDDGTISISNPSTRYLQGNEVDSATYAQQLLGHFVTCAQGGTGFAQNVIYYIPADAQITRTNHIVYVDRYQPVTGYAAIPAGTTIEYLGKLGDKARMQVVSYVGTGTYGSDNQCSITADFKIKSAIMMYHYIPSAGSIFMISDELSTDYTSNIGFSKDNAYYSWGKKSADGKTLFWYGTRSESGQFNESGKTYYVLCIG